MTIQVNIPAKITFANISKQWQGKKVRLILDEEADGEIYWGIPTLVSTEIRESRILDRVSLEYKPNSMFCRALSVKFKESGTLFSREYSIDIFSTQLVSFKVYKKNGQMFIDQYHKLIKKREQNRKDLEDFRNICNSLITRKVKVSGRVHLRDFAKKITPQLGPILAKYYPEQIFEPRSSSEEREDHYFNFVKKWLEDAIECDDLSGFIDENDNYVDRALMVQEKRITHMNILLDFNELLHQLGDRGVILTSIQCPQCKGSCSLPKTGATACCNYCGTTIKVTDVLDRFKGILGQ